MIALAMEACIFSAESQVGAENPKFTYFVFNINQGYIQFKNIEQVRLVLCVCLRFVNVTPSQDSISF